MAVARLKRMQIGVGSGEDGLLRGGIEMLDRPAGPDLADVSAGSRSR
jgi:hypothetical protein